MNLTQVTRPTQYQTSTTIQHNNQVPDEKPYWYWIVVIIIGCVTTFGNWLVIYVILTRRRLQTIANWYILSLAISDLLIGVFVVPSAVAHEMVTIPHFPIWVMFYNSLFYVSVGNLCVMTLDRYIAVTQPFRYFTVMTNRRVILSVALAWLVPSLIGLLPITWHHISNISRKSYIDRVYYSAIVIGLEIIPCVVMVIIYARLFVIARKHSRQITAHRKACFESQSEYSRVAFGRDSSVSYSHRREQRSNLKAFATILLMFVACWTLSAYRTLCNYRLVQCTAVTTLLTQISRILMFLNTALNFIVYAILKADIRKEFWVVLRNSFKTFQRIA
ncbi:D(5)-like dopamine receptor [Exaiptasia diaphana]|uniref:G-protein coupled receptors family 1 profile domain-containing protein n=1 Tax=Exaiptasia diaphana TaxID=2652724 RepID=A0A913XU16_EXADI|nr:D(5)-like dopamine receptor [Exaiptasia diaphana]